MTQIQIMLKGLQACSDAIKWVGDRNTATAWCECPRGDWMLWLLAMMTGRPGWPNRQTVVALACDCAERALRFVPAGEHRPRAAIDTARAWCRGEATREEVRAAYGTAYAAGADATADAVSAAACAATAAYAAAYAAAAYAAADAAAACAATATYAAAAYAAAYAAYAAAAYAAADAAADAYSARTGEFAACASLIRARVQTIPDVG